jgi:hypothetical protein
MLSRKVRNHLVMSLWESTMVADHSSLSSSEKKTNKQTKNTRNRRRSCQIRVLLLRNICWAYNEFSHAKQKQIHWFVCTATFPMYKVSLPQHSTNNTCNNMEDLTMLWAWGYVCSFLTLFPVPLGCNTNFSFLYRLECNMMAVFQCQHRDKCTSCIFNRKLFFLSKEKSMCIKKPKGTWKMTFCRLIHFAYNKMSIPSKPQADNLEGGWCIINMTNPLLWVCRKEDTKLGELQWKNLTKKNRFCIFVTRAFNKYSDLPVNIDECKIPWSMLHNEKTQSAYTTQSYANNIFGILDSSKCCVHRDRTVKGLKREVVMVCE